MIDKTQTSVRVTVFIPTFNRLALLKRAVASVLACNCRVHLHILDNNSCDGTYDWLITLHDTELVTFQITRHPENIGATENFIAGFRAIKTDFFVPLADDDELAPDFLNKAIDIAGTYPDAGAVVGARANRDRDTWKVEWDTRRSTRLVQPKVHIQEFLTFGHYVTWSAILWRSEVLNRYKLYESLKLYGLVSDVYFQFKYFLSSPVYIEPIPAATFSIRPGQACSMIGLTADSIVDKGKLIALMQRELVIRFPDIDSSTEKSLLSHTVHNWALFIKHNRQSAISAGRDINLEQSIIAYIDALVPYIGFSAFPFLEEIQIRAGICSTEKRARLRLLLLRMANYISRLIRTKS